MIDANPEGIAIIGVTGRFPGAEDIQEFWRNLIAGVESISTFSDDELAAAGIDVAALKKIPDYIRARGVLKNAECFDAAFFGINPKEAEATDPQQRAFLEAAWSALESAGYTPENYRGSIGVFAGMTNNSYYLNNLHSRRDVTQSVGWLTTMMGNEKDYLATRVAYKLNLKGPALNIYTACSTSLVAVCQAVQSLESFQCDMALAGGVSISFPQHRGYQFQEGGITSPDGHCRAFDINAAGTVFSHGLGVVVLKRLADAIADGDEIHAVIKGAALNNDGSNKVSFTAPSVDGQAEVVALAQALAGFDPATISYIEAHGTATPLGDPIEVAALTQAFRSKTPKKNFCGIGTVKSNFGHLDAAAGIAGLIKATLSLKHKKLAPTLHFIKPNPKLELETSPFYVVDKLTDWKRGETPLRAGVSSFGVGGTNAHVVLEEAPETEPSGASRVAQLILLSAKSEASLDAATANLAEHFISQPETNLPDAAFTLQVGRANFSHRRILVCREAAEAAAALKARDAKKVFSGHTEVVNPPVVFMFPGQGAQYVNMGVEIYHSEPSFKEDVDRCAEILKSHIGLDLREVLYPAPEKVAWAEEQLIQTRITQPALFVIEYALAKLWMSWGIQPAAMIGHSVGEYVAGCLAGVFTLEEGLELVAGRARLVQAQPPGAMLAVRLSEAEVLPLLGQDLSVAAINSPNLCVVSGPHAAIEKLERELEEKKIVGRRLHTSHAFHSAMMEPVLAPFTELLSKVNFKSPQIPYVSNVTARWVTEKDATSPAYWAGHVRQAVRFADGVGELLKNQQYVMLEVGPGQTLAQLARQHPTKGANQTVLSSLATAKESGAELNSLLTTLGRLWLAGVQPDWSAYYANERRRRVSLPTYAFERKRYLVEPGVNEVIPWASPPVGQVIGGIERPVTTTSEAISSEAPAEAVETTSVDSQLSRKDRILKAITGQLSELSGMEAARLNPSASFLELGFDSLFLTQASLAYQNRYGVKVTFRQLLEDLPTLSDLAAYLDTKLAPDVAIAEPKATPSSKPVSSTTSGTRIMVSASAAAPKQEQKYFGPFKPIDVGQSGGLTDRQQKHLDDLIARYTERTTGSKRTTQEHRGRFADPRAAAGFKQLWKEMVYPIVAARSQGAKIWDVDGNEYIDITLGFGLGLLGHRPSFVVEAIEKQLALGMEIGPSSPLAGKVAELMCEFSGQERVTFCNTGSEAVTAALRVTRTVSGRNKVVMFTGSYHGIFDEVLVRPQVVNGELRSIPIAPGIAPEMVANMIVLEYGSDEALEILRKHGREIAAVLVEPVQSRRPEFQPREFLHQVRQITESTGTALIFDETVTGFRCHPGGAQAWFGIKADLSTYGKVVGGGLPIGVCCGRAHYLDALDGGKWQYGDESFPEVGVTFFAGTFVRHPLALAAAQAVLTHLKEQGPQLQDGLNQRAEKMVNELNQHFTEIGVPLRLNRFSSMYYVSAAPELKYSSLLFYHLREKGLHIWEGRPSFLSVVHTDEDISRIIRAFKESVTELQEGGFFPESTAAVEVKSATPKGPVVVPLTEAQKELWLGAQMGDSASKAFNDSFVIQMRGDLKLDLLRETLQLLVDRHDGLRTTFPRDGQGQLIASSLKLEIPFTDLSGLPAAERDAQFEKTVGKIASDTFDLANGPLLRGQIVKLAEKHHALLLAAHHLVVDGWSVGVLLLELSKYYSARTQGLPSPLEPALQFEAYSKWQGTEAHRGSAQAAEDFWLKKFHDHPASVELPTDRPRPETKTYESAQETATIDPQLYQTLKQAAAKQRCTLLTYLLAGFNVWLHRVTGQRTLIVGIPAAGQIAGEVQSLTGNRALVGHCVSLLPMRSDCQPETTFTEFLAHVRKETLDAYEHQSFTFGTLVRRLRIPRDASRVPLVSLTFNVDRAYSGFQLHGLEATITSPPKTFNTFDVGVNIVDFDRDMRVDFRYNKDLFEAATVQKWLKEWLELLRSLAKNPEQVLGAQQRLPEELRHRVLHEWNATEVKFPPDLCLHDLFERQARQTPEATALVFEGATLSYGDLERRANSIAHSLVASGVGKEVLVGIFLERSFEMVAAILGVLKAGGAFVPVDPSLPAERIAFILQDSAARVVITGQNLAGAIPKSSAKVICLDSAQNGSLGGHAPVLERTSDPRALAYVIYTSGSTGQPKGVMIEHRSIVNHLMARQREFPLDQNDRFLQKANLSFDIAVWEIFASLIAGGQSILATTEGQGDSGYLTKLMSRAGVTVAHFGPALMQLVVNDPEFGNCTSLRRMFCGGEPLTGALQKQFFARSKAELISQYGPTEATVDATWCRCERKSEPTTALIGGPIANTQAYILDSELQPVAIGGNGELYIGGDSLARGYLNHPELTAEKFIPHPFDSGAGARLYKTGDTCRFHENGMIEFIGRTDQQIKIRGFRVELGEIEAVLQQHPHVKSAVVTANLDGNGDKWIGGYVVPRDGKIPTNGLRTFLLDRLPNYMVPTAFMELAELPLTSSGKINRRALPVIERNQSPLNRDYSAPRTETEQAVERIWAEVLAMDRVSIDDDFFELGGHSLLAAQVATRVREAFQIDFTLGHLLRSPTVAQSAAAIEAELVAEISRLSDEEAQNLIKDSN